MKRSSGKKDTTFLEQLILYAASAALSSLVLYVGLRQLDPNRDAAKKALKHKRELAKRLGRPLIQTNQYEVKFDALQLYISEIVVSNFVTFSQFGIISDKSESRLIGKCCSLVYTFDF